VCIQAPAPEYTSAPEPVYTPAPSETNYPHGPDGKQKVGKGKSN
jgi:hypothetical protein